MSQMLFEGLTADELLALPEEELGPLVFGPDPFVARIGSAEILCRFRRGDGTLVLELGHIDGGGEGMLPALGALAQRYARRAGLARLDWQVHATHCARPNPKLRAMLERRGFAVEHVSGVGEVYRLVMPVRREAE